MSIGRCEDQSIYNFVGGNAHSHIEFEGRNLINFSTTKWEENSPDVVAAAAAADDGMELRRELQTHACTSIYTWINQSQMCRRYMYVSRRVHRVWK